MKKEFLLFLFILVFIISACTKGTDTDSGDGGGDFSSGDEGCMLTTKLAQQYCTIRNPIKESSVVCDVDTWTDQSVSGGGTTLISFYTTKSYSDDDLYAWNLYKYPTFDEQGVGDKAYLMPLLINDYTYAHSEKDRSLATREDLADMGFAFVVKKGDKIYKFESYDGKDRGNNNFCSVEQVKEFANVVIKGSAKPEKSACYKEENKNLLKKLVEKHCIVKSEFGKTLGSTFCNVEDDSLYSQIITVFSWGYDSKIKELSTVSLYDNLPSWDETGVGDEAWITSVYGTANTARESLDKEGFNLYVHKGDKVYQFLVSNNNNDEKIKDKEKYIYTYCNVEQTKALAKELIGETQ